MKRILIYIICMILAVPVFAQTRIWSTTLDGPKKHREKHVSLSGLRTTQYDGVHHLLGVSVDGAYSAMLMNIPNARNTPGGYSIGAGLHYDYLNGILLVQTGIDFRWQDVQNSVSDIHFMRDNLKDTWGLPFSMQYDMTNRLDRSRNFYIQVPAQVGFLLIGGCYVMFGPKLSVQLYGNTEVSNITTTTAEYDSRYIGTFEEMDNHGIRKEVPLSVTHEKLDLKIDVMAAIELGYEFAISTKGSKSFRKNDTEDFRLRIAGFVDAGMLNICKPANEILYEVPESTPYTFQTFDFHHVFTTPYADGYTVNNIFTGLKVTFLFYGYQSQEKCVLCGSRGIQKTYRK